MTSTSSLGASSGLSASHAAVFFTSFRARLASLDKKIEGASSSTETPQLVQELADTRKALLDETAQIPPRDREGHEKLLRELSEKLATRSRDLASFSAKDSASTPGSNAPQPKARFAFKRNPAKASVVKPEPAVSDAVASTDGLNSSSSKAPMPPSENPSSSSDLRLENLSARTLDLRKDPKTCALLTIQIRSLTDCIVVIPPLQGSLMVHGCARCLIIVEKCRQYRMHTTTDSTIVLNDCLTGATIEDCHRILFASSLPPRSSDTPQSRFAVQDFDHVSSMTESPHWRWLAPLDEPESKQDLQSAVSRILAPPQEAEEEVPEQLRSQVLAGLQDRISSLFP
ncbi:hypothetical protein A4X09_0g5636 [Tilletia walkeri]|uniref:C-CAP/cofactor C-like domain-containing protein n=1 Tax=Tilletia walkeri TaxID=117179 RepID=A0A8X7N534_9BASI|nr:hypothetical protein A4X09_0g5636 [Tilletia walkeri]